MYALLTGPLTVERITISLHDLPSALRGTKLVQLSDFHFDGRSLSVALLEAAITQSNAILPDLIVLTGDFITHRTQDIYKLTPYLQQLKSRLGIYAVLGNHDSASHSMQRAVQAALTAVGIVPLWNAIAYPLGEALPLVGLADLRSRECCPAQLIDQLPPTTPRIVLAHNPDTVDLLRSLRADLVLSGHTHGGQVVIPGMDTIPGMLKHASPWLPSWLKNHIPFLSEKCDRVFRHWEWASGLHRVESHQLYVNRGLGTYWPGRLFCPPELTVLTLV